MQAKLTGELAQVFDTSDVSTAWGYLMAMLNEHDPALVARISSENLAGFGINGPGSDGGSHTPVDDAATVWVQIAAGGAAEPGMLRQTSG